MIRTWVALLPVLAAGEALADPILLSKGRPKKDGIGKLVIVTNYGGRDARLRAVKRLAKVRDAKVLRFRDADIETVRKKLRAEGAEFVAVAVTPETVDVNFHYDVLELARGLDADPMPDFHFGYLSSRDGPDLEAMVDRILAREAQPPGTPVAKVVGLTGSGEHLKGLDFLLHFGHGQAWRVEKGMTGVEVGQLELPRAPVVWSGACFNGVLSRSYHKCAYQPIFMRPTSVAPERLMTLNWVHAGVSGYFAALEGDRGEMAVAEWDYFRERACSLGEVMTHQYRLAFTSLPATFESFPRYVPGRKKRMSFYNVMLRGMVSRLLLSDPSYRPLTKPLTKPVQEAHVDVEESGLRVTVSVLRQSNGHHLNYLPRSRKGIFDTRVTTRVELPEDAPKKLGEPTVTFTRSGKTVPVHFRGVRHEVWGGKRYLNLQVEAPPGRMPAGTQVTYVFPAK